MKIDLTQKLKNLDGEVFTEPRQHKGEDGKKKVDNVEVVLRDVLLSSLTNTFQEDISSEPNVRKELFQLALEVNNSEIINLKAEQIILLKNRISKLPLSNVIIGQVISILDDDMKSEV